MPAPLGVRSHPAPAERREPDAAFHFSTPDEGEEKEARGMHRNGIARFEQHRR